MPQLRPGTVKFKKEKIHVYFFKQIKCDVAGS